MSNYRAHLRPLRYNFSSYRKALDYLAKINGKKKIKYKKYKPRTPKIEVKCTVCQKIITRGTLCRECYKCKSNVRNGRYNYSLLD